MAKLYGRIKDDPSGAGNSKPDMRGSIKVGGFTGQDAEDKNREAALWLKNLVDEFQDGDSTWISMAIWKRQDKETGEPYLSICLEDNSWKKSKPLPAKSENHSNEDPFAV